MMLRLAGTRFVKALEEQLLDKTFGLGGNLNKDTDSEEKSG